MAGILGTITGALTGAVKAAANKTSSSSSKSKSSSSSSNSSTANTGYGTGTGYGSRETAYTWKDGSTTYSNATTADDAAREAGKTGVGLSSAVTYYSSGQQKANGNNSIYSNNTQTGKNYDNALTYEQQVANNYGLGNGTVQGSYGEGYGYTDPNLTGTADISSFGTTAANGYTNAYLNNPYSDLIKENESRYGDLEDQIRAMNAASVKQGVSRLESNRTGIQDYYEDSARQAYVAMMQQNKNLVSQLEADGLNGGATETGRLGISNTYLNNLNTINTGLNKEMSNLDNSIVDLQNTGDLQTQQQILANSQAALDAYNALKQSSINYDYTLSRDQVSDQRYAQEWANQLQQQEYAKQQAELQQAYTNAFTLWEMGYSTAQTASILGISEADVKSQVDYMNSLRDLDLKTQEASLAKTLSSGSSSSSSSKQILSYSQMMDAINSGSYTPNVLNAYQYYMGSSYQVPNTSSIDYIYNNSSSAQQFSAALNQASRVGTITQNDIDAWERLNSNLFK